MNRLLIRTKYTVAELENFIHQNYPNARKGKELTKECMGRLVHDHRFDPEKTLMATSVCSDEIVRSATNFREYLASESPFQLGGLAGYPFTGLTGLKAFGAHIPDGGTAIIQYGPHIGVSKTGEVGNMQRIGQMAESSCCGALQASLAALGKQVEPADPELDYQLWKIEEELEPKRETIFEHAIPLVAATDCMFEIINRTIHSLIRASGEILKGHRIALVGGVIINTDYNLSDWFDLRNFEVIDL